MSRLVVDTRNATRGLREPALGHGAVDPAGAPCVGGCRLPGERFAGAGVRRRGELPPKRGAGRGLAKSVAAGRRLSAQSVIVEYIKLGYYLVKC